VDAFFEHRDAFFLRASIFVEPEICGFFPEVFPFFEAQG